MRVQKTISTPLTSISCASW